MNNRKLAKQILKENNFSNEQANNAWYNQVLALRRNSDLRGKELRDQAYRNIATSFIKDPMNRQLTAEPVTVMTAQPSFNGAPAILPLRERVKAATPQYKTFGEAFAAARKAGLKEFEWKGKNYNTNIANNNPSEPYNVKRRGKSYNTNITNNTPTIPEVPIDIADSNVEVQDDFTTLSPNWYGPFLKPVFFDKNPQIGWPMPIKGENVVTKHFWRFF